MSSRERESSRFPLFLLLKYYISSGERYRLMSQEALKFAKPGAATALAQDILSLIKLN